ncbi:DUF4169 family protein [Salipiger sp. PrR002]|uniref:DUF4169 family protein n=1 Tax=Salipiger sp. PrR002 TaxID=2706489 RepID=UPI0013BD6A3C|nr:DUF4169 family protein [Salipiger sp. PrR002]NDV98116.1 DUF4169 family protein [Salipiger sp. PrR002]NDW57091.1 DUF4169 family protein [Salipiger sp. PrR004]
MSNVVNLNRFRKSKARAEKRAQADENAVRHGLSKAEKKLEERRSDKAARSLEGHRLDTPDGTAEGDGTPEGDETSRS